MSMFDAHLLFIIVGIAAFGGLLGLDRTAAGQFMISQPIVAGPLTGWLLGDPTAGIIIGAVLELIWVLDIPVGSFVPANSTVSSVSATAIAVIVSNGPASLSVIGFCLLLTTGIVPITMMADTVVRKWNSRLAETAVAGLEGAVKQSLVKAHFFGLTVFYFKSFLLYLIFLPVGIAVAAVFVHLPEQFHRAMSFFVKFLPFLGAALIVRKLSIKIFDAFFLTGFMIAAVLGYLIPVPAFLIILLTVIAGLLGVRYGEARH